MQFRTSLLIIVAILLCFSHHGLAAKPTTQPNLRSKLALTPPMGWNSWNAFRLQISDAGIRSQAAAMVKDGMKDAGYEYVVIDGGWEGPHDAQGNFHSDPQRFPDMKALCDYVHSLGLKIGIHTSPGPVTCAGREASYGHEAQDAQTFAKWGIDFVKYDWCSAGRVYQQSQMQAVYKKFSDDLNATGRPILFSLCQYGMQEVWKWGPAVDGQMWRTTGDISDDYWHMITIGFGQNGLEKYAGPGHWNDPDLLEIGNQKMNPDEWRTQMSLWSILAAPLMASNDLTNMSDAAREILLNKEVIAVDQDSAGIQGHCAQQEGPIQFWIKPLHDGTWALAVFSIENHPMDVVVNFFSLGLPKDVRIRDLWKHQDCGEICGNMAVGLPKHGCAAFKVVPLKPIQIESSPP